MTANFINLERDSDIQVNEAHRSPNKLNIERSPPGHITVKLSKAKKESRRTREEKPVIYKKNLCKTVNGFLSRNLRDRKQWHDIFKVLKE